MKALSLARAFPVFVVLAAFLPRVAHAGFEDRTASSGLLWFQSSWGATFVDLDRDGDLDLYTGHHFFDPIIRWNDGSGFFDPTTHPQPWTGPTDRHGVLPVPLALDEFPDLFIAHGAGGGAGTEPNELYRNDGGGVLSPVTGAGGLDDPPGRARCASAADYDGDQMVDVWVGKAPDPAHPNSLFRNEGLYSFVDVAASVGLDDSNGAAGGIWGDYDDDGDPDLLVGSEEFPRPTTLHRNDGGTFSNASSIFTPPLPVVSGADWGDFDLDGDLDLVVCDGQIGLFDTVSEEDTLTFFFNTRYSENGVDGLTIPATSDTMYAQIRIRGFLDFTKIFLGPDRIQPSPAAWIVLTDDYVGAPVWDPGVDHGTFVWRQSPGGPWELRCSTPFVNFDTFDGTLRNWSMFSGVTEHDLEDPGFVPGGPRVWRNDGGAFTEVTAALGLPDAMVNPRDVSWVDYDNDGDHDLHVVDMGTSATRNAPDALFRNDGSVFTDVTVTESIGGGAGGLGDGATWGDADRDGDLDVYVAQGAGPLALGGFGPALFYRNEGTWPPSLQLSLVGQESGPAALGAKVTALVGGRTIVRHLAANSWRGFADPLEIHIGMGGAALVDSLVIEWPFGTIHVYTDVPPGFYRIEEATIALDAPAAPLAARGWRITSVRPQPARGSQSVALAVDRAVRLEVGVYDLAGRLVRTLHEGAVAAGTTTLAWDGRDARGRRVAAGVYFVRATDGRSLVAAKSIRLH